ncbi:hypothetical protein ES705_33646 [subsurface metagenome]
MKKHTKKEIMEQAGFKNNFQDKHTWLIVELLCDIRDEQERHNKKIERLAILKRKGI